MTTADDKASRGASWLELILLFAIAGILPCLFWWPIVQGGGLIGGDTYNYFFPLKDYYGEGLKQGELRLWHTGIGNGVPVLGESQTGVFYPFNLLAYRFLDLNSAYSAVFLGHYVLAYLFAYGLARQLGAGVLGSHFGSLVFVYGWFPPRACLEWSIVTGAWMPALLGCSIALIQRPSGRWFWATAFCLAVQLFAGHFNLAWVTLVAVGIVGLFPWGASGVRTWLGRRALLVGALVTGFILASPQLIPAWELKQISQRSEEDFAAEIEQGLVPWRYWGETMLGARYLTEGDERLAQLGAATNMVEAHLYFGLLTPVVVLSGFLLGERRRTWPWMMLGLASVLLATGTIMPYLAPLPGFSFFRYCGRYGLATQLAVAVLAALVLRPARASFVGRVLLVALFGITCWDLCEISGRVQYTTVVRPPLITFRDQSPIFRQFKPTDRVFAVDGNTLSLSGAATVPPYLGMGPASYYEIWDRFPNIFQGEVDYREDLVAVLNSAGITHLLVFEPLPTGWPATLIWHGFDPFLHRRWARDPSEPIYLYTLDGAWGRVFAFDTLSETRDESCVPRIVDYSPHRVTVEVSVERPGGTALVLTDLDFAGWRAHVSGPASNPHARVALPVDKYPSIQFARSVSLDRPGAYTVTWTYHPRSMQLGWLLAGSVVAVGLARWLFLRMSTNQVPVAEATRG